MIFHPFLLSTSHFQAIVKLLDGTLNLILLNMTTSTFVNSVDLDQKKASDQDLHCLSFCL